MLLPMNRSPVAISPMPSTCTHKVKKKAFKINAKIENVGLNEDKKVRKQEMVTKFS